MCHKSVQMDGNQGRYGRILLLERNERDERKRMLVNVSMIRKIKGSVHLQGPSPRIAWGFAAQRAASGVSRRHNHSRALDAPNFTLAVRLPRRGGIVDHADANCGMQTLWWCIVCTELSSTILRVVRAYIYIFNRSVNTNSKPILKEY